MHFITPHLNLTLQNELKYIGTIYTSVKKLKSVKRTILLLLLKSLNSQ